MTIAHCLITFQTTCDCHLTISKSACLRLVFWVYSSIFSISSFFRARDNMIFHARSFCCFVREGMTWWSYWLNIATIFILSFPSRKSWSNAWIWKKNLKRLAKKESIHTWHKNFCATYAILGKKGRVDLLVSSYKRHPSIVWWWQCTFQGTSTSDRQKCEKRGKY